MAELNTTIEMDVITAFGWMSIDTAPKDGRDIWVVDAFGRTSTARWQGKVNDKTTLGNSNNYWQGVCCGWNAWCGHEEVNVELEKLTHWMPVQIPV